MSFQGWFCFDQVTVTHCYNCRHFRMSAGIKLKYQSYASAVQRDDIPFVYFFNVIVKCKATFTYVLWAGPQYNGLQ